MSTQLPLIGQNQGACKLVGVVDLSDKPLLSKSSGGFTLASKASLPTFARAKQEASDNSREKQKRGRRLPI